MGRVTLPGSWYIDVSDRNYCLRKEPRTPHYDKNGRLIDPEPVAWCSSFVSALNTYRRVYGRELIHDYEGDITLSKAVELLTEAENRLNNTLKEYNLNEY